MKLTQNNAQDETMKKYEQPLDLTIKGMMHLQSSQDTYMDAS